MTQRTPIRSVAYVTPGWPTIPNGVAAYALRMQRALAAAGVEALLLARAVGAAPPPEVIDIAPEARARSLPERLALRLLGRFGADRALAFECTRSTLDALRRLHRERGTRILEMEESLGIPGRIARRAPVPVVTRLHGPWFLNGAARGVPRDDAFERRVRAEGIGLTRTQGITAPSRDVLRRTREHYGLPLAHAVVIPNPVALSPVDACWGRSACDPERIAFIGRFDRHKGGDVVIDAFARVLEHRPEARLVFVGPDRGLPDADGRPWQIEAYARERLGAKRDRLEWVGEQPFEALPSFRRAAALTVVASRYENLAYTALEAMAMGCPIVSTEAGGLAETVEDGRNALTCKEDDAAALASRILLLLENPELAARLGEQARADCAERYAPERVAQQTLAYYEDVLERTARDGGAPLLGGERRS
jgi:glycosyltransferase involved in cell wall biosynthesis